jgi:hypothetical protein
MRILKEKKKSYKHKFFEILNVKSATKVGILIIFFFYPIFKFCPDFQLLSPKCVSGGFNNNLLTHLE